MITKVEKRISEIFNKKTKSSQIYEALVFVESANGDISFSKGYGGRELDSPMLMASITKLCTTTCILILLEQQFLSLEDKVTKYFTKKELSQIHTYKRKEYTDELTVSDLLFQTSGLPDIYEEGSIGEKVIKEDFEITFDEKIKLTQEMKAHFEPNKSKSAHYSDINFDLLGEIVVKVTKKTLAKTYSDMIFKPLKLKGTYLPVKEKDIVPSVYYKNEQIKRFKFIKSSGASGGCVTTARDLMVFIKAFFRRNFI